MKRDPKPLILHDRVRSALGDINAMRKTSCAALKRSAEKRGLTMVRVLDESHGSEDGVYWLKTKAEFA